MAFLASIGDLLVTIGLYTVATAFVASVAVAIAAHLAYRYTTKLERRYDRAPAADPRERIQVIGGNRISSDERWAKCNSCARSNEPDWGQAA